MSRFLNRPRLELASDQDDGKWVLVEALFYVSDLAGRTIVVPPGFQTDLASVPRLPVVYLLTGNTSTAAAILHDWLYSAAEFPRKMADDIFLEASEATGVPWFRRWLMWAGVRIGGSANYAG